MKHWEFHPKIPTGSERSIGERAADGLRLGMGSWPFFGIFGILLVVWIVSGGFGWDGSPYFHLNLVLSMVAGLQGSALLIADKRSDRIRAEVAEFHLELTRDIHDLLEEVHAARIASEAAHE